MVLVSNNYPHNSSNNYLDDGGSDSDGHLFSSPELDRDSTDTDLSLKAELKGFHERLPEDTVPVAERSRTGDSAGGNSISFTFSSGECSRAADG